MFKALAFSFILCISFIYTKIVGIDLGSEFIKASIIKPNRPFSMVENLQSKTKTPFAIAFKDDERLFGADALAKKVRFPKQVFTFLHEFLGKKYNDEQINSFIEKYFISYDIEEDPERGTINFKLKYNKEDYTFSTEEMFGMMFRYIRMLAEKYSEQTIKDCVVTVPSFFGYKERMALHQAIQIAGMNLITYVSENVAAATHFALDRKFNGTEYYIFYNMGSSYTQATLVAYNMTATTKSNKTIENKHVEVLAETWDKRLGGRSFDYNMIRLLMNKFDALPERAGKPTVAKDYKIAEKMLPSAIKYKEILSANKEFIINVLNVDGGLNLGGRITRDEFETVSADDLNRAISPIEALFKNTNLTIENISQIELLGGAHRIPKVQEQLKAKYGNLVGAHMNSDDSMALGAAFIAANSSLSFKAQKKVRLSHGPNYDIIIRLAHFDSSNICEDNHEGLASDCTRKLSRNTTLFKQLQGVDKARTVSFKHDSDFYVNIYEKFEDSDEKLLMTYNITGFNKTIESMLNQNITTQPKVHLRFKLNAQGSIKLTVILK